MPSEDAILLSASVCRCKHAVDAETDLQARFLRLDVDVRSANLRRIIEHGLQQLDHRRFFQADCIGQRAEIDIAFAQVFAILPAPNR